MLTLNDGRSELWQWDTGRKLTVDTECSQVHFSNKVFGRSIDIDVVDGVASIPDILLQADKELTAWAFVGTAENGYTKISKTYKVNRRNKPADYVFTPTDQTTLDDILDRIEDLEKRPSGDISEEDIQNAVNDYLEKNPVSIDEKDPTVPAWAKQPEKPKYTADEVGALSAETKIPEPYVLPVATIDTLGGVKPVAKGADMTQEIGVDELGGLWTAPGGGGSEVWKKIHDATLEESTQNIVVSFFGSPMRRIRLQLDTLAADADTSYGSITISTDSWNNAFRTNRTYLAEPPPRKNALATYVDAEMFLDDVSPSMVVTQANIVASGNVRFPSASYTSYYNNPKDPYGSPHNSGITAIQINTYGTFVAGTKIRVWGIPV